MAQQVNARAVDDEAAGVAMSGAAAGAAVGAAGSALPASAGGRLLAQVKQLGPQRLAVLGLVALAFAAFFAFIIARAFETRYTLLYADLDLAASQEIVQRLETLGVPYRLNGGGDAIMVPADEALRLRMSLAEEGLPGGGVVGYEIFDSSDPFGTTEFLSNVNLKRALEGELARTIGSMRQVRSARVHIVQPKRELFQRERTKPSASVFLSLNVAGSLERREIAAIQHLVAAAVPALDAKGVTVLDDAGTLLARGGEQGAAGYLMDEADAYRVALEERLKRKVITLLERTVGPDRVDAQITAEIDFDEVTTTHESFDPEGQVVRSTQTVEEQREANEREGDDTVTVANNLPADGDAQGGAGDASQEQSNRIEETINYEVSRTVRNQLKRGGRLDRLSVAVQVDGLYAPDEAGVLVFRPRDAEELAELETLVRSALGIDEARGDTLSIVSRQFVTPEPEAAPEAGLFDINRTDLLSLVELLVLLIATVLVLLFGVRPLFRHLVPPPQDQPAALATEATGRALLSGQSSGTTAGSGERDEEAEGEIEGYEDVPAQRQLIESGLHADLIQEVVALVKYNPDEAVRALRTWLVKD